MWQRLRERRDVDHWLAIHDRLNDIARPFGSRPPMFPPIPTMILDQRAFRLCPYSSDFVAGCCSAPATVKCHWKAATVTLPTCLDCVKEMV